MQCDKYCINGDHITIYECIKENTVHFKFTKCSVSNLLFFKVD